MKKEIRKYLSKIGSAGGKKVLKKYGSGHFKKIRGSQKQEKPSEQNGPAHKNLLGG